jgi:hypothetical protein
MEVIPIVVLVVVVAAAAAASTLAWFRSSRSGVRHRSLGPLPHEPAELIDDDTRNALTIGAGTDHAWLASARAARARAVTEQARHSRGD